MDQWKLLQSKIFTEWKLFTSGFHSKCKSNSYMYQPKENIVGIVSTCHTDSVIVSSLLSRMNITIPLMCTSLVSNTATGHGIFYMSSFSSVIINACLEFLHLLKQFNWTIVIIVIHSSHRQQIYFLKKKLRHKV